VGLRALGGRYHRYLHQDEFGPSRAERMAGLRALVGQLHLLLSLLGGLPKDLRPWLSDQLTQSGPPRFFANSDLKFASCSNDAKVALLLAEAAVVNGAVPEAELVAGLASAAEQTAHLLSLLDTTAGALVDEFQLAPLKVACDREPNLAIVCARIQRLSRRVELALAQLEHRRGPEPSISLKWLVSCLCDLYHRETGQPVTSSAVKEYFYTGIPQSPAASGSRASTSARITPVLREHLADVALQYEKLAQGTEAGYGDPE
jgi:hypothetical protein